MIIDYVVFENKYRSLHKSHISEEYAPKEGLAQGGILSCTLWNLYAPDIPLDDRIYFAAFADDLAVVASQQAEAAAYSIMSSYYEKLRKWAADNHVEFNDKKVKAVRMLRKGNRKRPRKKDLQYGTDTHVLYRASPDEEYEKIPNVESHRYLGSDH